MSLMLFLRGIALAGGTCAALTVNAQGPAGPPGEAQGSASSGVAARVAPPPASGKQPPTVIVHPPALSEYVWIQSEVRQQPQTVCAMKLWRVDPGIDPGIRIRLPESAANAKIKRIPATECVAGASHARREVFQSGRVYFDAPQLQPRPAIPADVGHALVLIPIVLGTAW